MANLDGKDIGRYHITEQLGQGGMATVYKAYDTRLERTVAIKIIRTSAFSQEIIEQVLKRFEREAKSLARMNHPNIVGVIDYGEHEGSPYLVMEYMPGGTLKEYMGSKPIPWPEAFRILLPIVRALGYAHKNNILHRDVKPANILITDSNEPMLSDFGIAKILEDKDNQVLTGTGVGIGTPEYMAPEQGKGDPIDARADIYALGVVLYEMITGRRPFSADTPMAVVLKHISEPLPSPQNFVPDLPDSVALLIVKAMSKNREDRFEDMNSFAQAMERAISNADTQAAVLLQKEPAQTLASVFERPEQETVVSAVPMPGAARSANSAAIHPTTKVSTKSCIIMVLLGLGGGLILILIATGIFLFNRGSLTVPPAPTIKPTDIIVSNPPIPTEENVQAPPLDQLDITIWHVYEPGSAEETALTRVVSELGQDIPNVNISLIPVPFADLFTRYNAEVTAGGGPDMFIAPNDDLGENARAGTIADITEMAAGKLDDYSDLSIEGMTLDGSLYGIPETMKAVTLWYNTDLLSEPPSTTDELKTLMESGTSIVIPYNCYHYWGFYNAFGGQVFDDNWKIIADQDGMIDAMNYLNDLYQISKDNNWPQNDETGSVSFSEGEVAGIINGNWATGDYEAALGDKLAVAVLPAGPAGSATPLLGVEGFYLNPNSPNLETALEVALLFTGPQAQTIMMEEAGHLPVNLETEITDPLIMDLRTAFEEGVYFRPQVPQFNRYWDNFCEPEAVFENGIPAAKWLEEATANANK